VKVGVMDLTLDMPYCSNIAAALVINQSTESECMEIAKMKLSAYYFGG